MFSKKWRRWVVSFNEHWEWFLRKPENPVGNEALWAFWVNSTKRMTIIPMFETSLTFIIRLFISKNPETTSTDQPQIIMTVVMSQAAWVYGRELANISMSRCYRHPPSYALFSDRTKARSYGLADSVSHQRIRSHVYLSESAPFIPRVNLNKLLRYRCQIVSSFIRWVQNI